MRKKLILLSIIIGVLLSLIAYFQHLQIIQSIAPIPTRGRSFTSYRDAEGVAHIEGDSIFDVLYAQGYDHAQNRLFQMDTMRRVISGRLSELIGEKTVEIDKYFRTFGIFHAVNNGLDQLNDYQRKILEAFAAGVNDYALQDMKIHPLEYWLTNSKFEKWEPRDSVLLTKLIYYQMTFDFQFELMREKMAKAVGWDLVDKVITSRESQFKWGTQAYILNDEELAQSGLLAKEEKTKTKEKKSESQSKKQKEAEPKGKQGRKDKDTKQQGRESIKGKSQTGKARVAKGGQYLNQNQGSNCWAVHGNYTESGAPMLMGDPHMGNTVPGLWVINELKVKENYAYGSALPGLPGVFIGRTNVAAWSLTNMGADVADLFFERIEGNKYYHNGWHDLKERKEVIKVKGSDPVELIVQSTDHGPLVHQIIQSVNYAFLGKVDWDQSTPISLQWAGIEHPIDKFQFGTLFNTPELINTGEKLVNSFKQGYNGFQMSMCFATINGDIGYLGGVKHPVKGSDTPHRISDGQHPQNNWTQYVPESDLPFVINPKKGFVSCSNQRVASDKMHFPFASNMAPMSRAVTQQDILSGFIKKGKKITVQDMKALQHNVHDSLAEQLLPLMVKLLPQKTKVQFKESVQMLESWDLNAQENSIAASIFYMWENMFLAGLFEGFSFPGGVEEKLSYFRNFMWEQWFIQNLEKWAKGQETQSQVCGKTNFPVEGNCVKLMQTAFEQAHDVLTQKLGEDKKIWVWGNIHRMHYTHAMSPTPLKPFFHKSYASLGTRRNLNVAGYYVNDKFAFDGLHSGNLRVLVDMGGPSYWSVDMGLSGIKGSEHYDDLHDQHQRGGYVKMEPMNEKK